MKKGQVKLIGILCLLITVLIINCVISIFNTITFVLFLMLLFLVLKYVVGFDKKNPLYKNNNMLYYILVITVFFMLFQLLLGFFFGFLQSSYKLTILNIMKNAFPVLITIVLIELSRYAVIRKGYKYKLIVFLLIIATILFDMTLSIHGFNMADHYELLKFILTICLTSLAKNIFLTYLSYLYGYKETIVYRLILELPLYILPLLPNLGLYLDIIINIIFPSILFLFIHITYKQKKNYKNMNRKLGKALYIIPTIVLIITITLTSGIFKYYALTIGSGSMSPNIEKGDIIIVDKLNDEEKHQIEVGEVLVFKHNDIVVVHRVIEIVENEGTKVFYTKGDFNNAPDNYSIAMQEIIGVSKIRIAYLGYPTVWISEFLNK